MARSRIVYIAGAGISGLTLALALAKFDLRVIVLERETAVHAFGAGLQISPNARKILDRLGLGPALDAAAFRPEGIDVVPAGAIRPIQTLALGDTIAARFGAPYAVMHRGDLAQTLHAATKRFANIEIVYGVTRFSIQEGERGLRVFYTAEGEAQQGPAFAFVGADGVNSQTRAHMPDGQPARESGAIAWRTLASPEALGNGLRNDRTTLLPGPGHHMVIYPLPARAAVNMVLFTERATQQDDDTNATPRMPPNLGGQETIKRVVERVGPHWTPWTIKTHAEPVFGRGAVALVGDAAHAMLPFQAQGAAMGMEDAATLATLLATAPQAAHAVARYESLRRERIARVTELSRRNGEIFHMGWPAKLARDAVIRFQGPRAHLSRLAWLYGHEIAESESSGSDPTPR